MGAGAKLIVCCGVRSEDPFTLPTGVHVYSIEELCYYVYENVIRLDESLFGETLIRWLKDKCRMDEIADKLVFLGENGYTFKDRVVALLCSCDYYSENEIIALIKKMNDWENTPDYKKIKLFGDESLKEGQYHKARAEYEQCLNYSSITDDVKAGIYHNIGVCKMYTASAAEAAESFRMAYVLSGSEESLRQCLMAYIIDGREGDAFKLCNKEGVNPYLMNRCMEEYGQLISEADASPAMEELELKVAESRTGNGLNDLISDWKREVRG